MTDEAIVVTPWAFAGLVGGRLARGVLELPRKEVPDLVLVYFSVPLFLLSDTSVAHLPGVEIHTFDDEREGRAWAEADIERKRAAQYQAALRRKADR